MKHYTNPQIEIFIDLYKDVIMTSSSSPYGKELIGEDPY